MFGVTDQLDEDFALASALAAEAAHDLLQGLAHRTHLGAQGLGRWGPLTGDTLDEAQHFFWALYRVVASVTRWLPCSEGKVSMSRWAGLTRPSSIAAAAWMATSSSIRGWSIRLRNCARVSGKTKCACGLSSCTTSRPQAYMTATSVRKRSQISSSEAPTSCLRSSRASKTRVETG